MEERRIAIYNPLPLGKPTKYSKESILIILRQALGNPALGLLPSDQETITINNHKDKFGIELQHKIYREQDSINIAIHQITCYLEGKKVDKGNFDAIALSFTDTYNQQGFFIYKRNDIAHYINQ